MFLTQSFPDNVYSKCRAAELSCVYHDNRGAAGLFYHARDHVSANRLNGLHLRAQHSDPSILAVSSHISRCASIRSRGVTSLQSWDVDVLTRSLRSLSISAISNPRTQTCRYDQNVPLAAVARIQNGNRVLAITYWYETYHEVYKGGQYFRIIDEMHAKYGRESPLQRKWIRSILLTPST